MNRNSATLKRTEAAEVNDPSRPPNSSPSAWPRRIGICLLAAVAFSIASYLALYQWGIKPSVWDPVFGQGSRRVLDSSLSDQMQSWLHIPDAALGAAAYLAEMILGLAGSDRRWKTRPWIVAAFGINGTCLVILSLALVIFQSWVVKSWCFLCLITAAISILLAVLASHEINACRQFLWRTWRWEGDHSSFWNVFWGHASKQAAGFAPSRQSKTL